MKELTAQIKKVNGNKVWLDQTNFFAFSGGQESDAGTIGGVRVLDAVEDGDTIYYVLEKNSFKPNQDVKIEIDWARRYKIMRLHSATHIAWIALFRKIGEQKVIGSHVSEEKGRIDFEYAQNVSPILPSVEQEVNEMLKQNLEIRTFFNQYDLETRLWLMEKYDHKAMPCSGTHVKNTKEIVQVRLKRVNIGAGKERVEVHGA